MVNNMIKTRIIKVFHDDYEIKLEDNEKVIMCTLIPETNDTYAKTEYVIEKYIDDNVGICEKPNDQLTRIELRNKQEDIIRSIRNLGYEKHQFNLGNIEFINNKECMYLCIDKRIKSIMKCFKDDKCFIPQYITYQELKLIVELFETFDD